MNKVTKWTLGILGTIMLGALGSGFWDLCLRDSFSWLGRVILSLVTLGLSSVRDSFYVEIAKGRTDRVSIFLVSFGFMFLGAFVGFFLRGSRSISKMRAEMTPSDQRFMRWTLGFCLLLINSVLMFRSISISYSVSAIDHFEQSYAICLPYLSAQERDEVRSRFAQIHSKDDYVRVLAFLSGRAQQNKIDLPKFSIW